MAEFQTYKLADGATLMYFPKAIDYSLCELDEMVSILSEEERLKFKMYGKPCVMRRKQKMFGDFEYKFSSITVPRHNGPVPSLIHKCLDFCEKAFPNLSPNAILANYYEPKDYISAHRDNEGAHAKGKPIVGFSFGEARILTIKSYKRKRDDKDYVKRKFILEPGSAYAMVGEQFQTLFTHEVGRGKGNRLSLTAREFCL